MYSGVRRAAAFAAVASLALAAPVVGGRAIAAVPFALIAVGGRLVSEGPLFELFARPSDRQVGELRGLVGFALAATALALVTALTGLSVDVFVAAVLLLGYGNLAEQAVRAVADGDLARAAAFVAGGALAAFAGFGATAAIVGGGFVPPEAALLSVAGGLVGALVRAVRVERDDPLVMVLAALSLWLLAAFVPPVTATELAVAVGIAGALGYLSWRLETASLTGMLTGVLLSLLTIVLGGYGWFALLIAFFGLGGLAAKFRYDEKRRRGVAEGNGGARGSRNVLGNAAVALVAVIGFAAGDTLGVEPSVFLFAFAGSLATATSDTLSSEVGVVIGGPPRLVTTLRPVEAGTDGGVSPAGTVAGIGGAGIIALLSLALLPVPPAGAAAIVVAGVAGMLIDSLLGAVLEGGWIGNQSVNFLATLAGGAVGVVAGLAL